MQIWDSLKQLRQLSFEFRNMFIPRPVAFPLDYNFSCVLKCRNCQKQLNFFLFVNVNIKVGWNVSVTFSTLTVRGS